MRGARGGGGGPPGLLRSLGDCGGRSKGVPLHFLSVGAVVAIVEVVAVVDGVAVDFFFFL